MDTILTDSVEHNKGVNQVLADMYSLDKPAGQIFCGTHTVLGSSQKQLASLLLGPRTFVSVHCICMHKGMSDIL